MCIYFNINSYFLLTDEVQATTEPKELVVINGITGEVTYEFKAYPRPNIKICYNDTCGSHGTYGRMQVATVHSQDDTIHTARLTVHRMREEDNGNVTIEVRQPEKDNEFTDEVVLFLLCKYQYQCMACVVRVFLWGRFYRGSRLIVITYQSTLGIFLTVRYFFIISMFVATF